MADLNKLINTQYSAGKSLNIGDRYFAQDLGRDIDYLRSLSGQEIKNLYASFPVFISGGLVTQGSGANLNISPAVGLCKFSVTVPDVYTSVPPTTTSMDIVVLVSSTQQTNMAITPAAGTTYVKLRYKEANGNTRIRALIGGTYSYEVTDSFEFVVDGVANTDYDILLATLTNASGVYTVNQKYLTEIKARDYTTTQIRQDCYEFEISEYSTKTIKIQNDMKLWENLKYLGGSTAYVWATSAGWNLNTARYGIGGSGTQSSSLSFGGGDGGYSAVTELFNGSTWATGAGYNLNTAREDLGGCGTKFSSLSFGGNTGSASKVTELFNGSTWATGAGYNLNTAKYSMSSSGIKNSALNSGGQGGGILNVTELFNGATWSASGNLNTARQNLSGSGTQNSALSFGGLIAGPASSAVTEKFNGLTWIASGNLNTARYFLSGSGTQNSTLSFGGFIAAVSAVTELFNGATWSASGNLNTARNDLSGCGTRNTALSFGGVVAPTRQAITEKYNISSKLKQYVTVWENRATNDSANRIDIESFEENVEFTIKCPAIINYTITQNITYDQNCERLADIQSGLNIVNYGAFTATGSLNAVRAEFAGFGSQNSSIASCGRTTGPTLLATTEKFNGNTWTAGLNSLTARTQLGGIGITNAGLNCGGDTGSVSLATESYNGQVWAASGNLNTARTIYRGSNGIKNSGISIAGYSIAYSNDVETYNGSVWTIANNSLLVRDFHTSCGIKNASLTWGGYTTGPATTATVEQYNGYTWEYKNSVSEQLHSHSGCGNINFARSLAGNSNGLPGASHFYNGVAWQKHGECLYKYYAAWTSGSSGGCTKVGGCDNAGTTFYAECEKFSYNTDIAELFGLDNNPVNKTTTNISY